MTLTEQEVRKEVVKEALSWLTTPYHHRAMKKGVGVDCAMLLKAVYVTTGVIKDFKVEHYPNDWHLHRDAERYMSKVFEHATEISGDPKPGDVVLFKFGRCFSHGAIVVDWPVVVHAYVGRGCLLEDVEKAPWLTHIGERGPEMGKIRPRKYFSLWGG